MSNVSNQMSLEDYLAQSTCGFPQVKEVLSQVLADAMHRLSPKGLSDLMDGANFICKIGKGVEPVLIYLEEMPIIAQHLGEESLTLVKDKTYKIARSPNGKAVVPFLQSLSSLCRRIDSVADLLVYFDLLDTLASKLQTVIHGHHNIHPSAGYIPFLEAIPTLIGKLSLSGLQAFVEYGARNYKDYPDQQKEYFSLKSADAKSIILREREGVVFKDIERQMDMMQQILWNSELPYITFSTAFDQLRKPVPYLEDTGMRIPDVYEDEWGVSGIDRYRATIHHLLAHKTWSTNLLADNYAPHMQFFISVFEDARVDTLAMGRYPGLKNIFLKLHVYPELGACDEQKQSCLRYRATRLSRALLDPDFDPQDELMTSHVQRFRQILAEKGEQSTTADMLELGMSYYVKSRVHSDSTADVFFDKTEVSYRDDNRNFWFYYEENDEAEDFHNNEYQSDEEEIDTNALPPRHYQEWDYISESYRPDWATVYERLHPKGNARDIDKLLEKHASLAKQLKKMIEMLKPQNKKRIRFQEEGEELDLDVAIRSMIDFKSGQAPDSRINFSHETDSRNFAVMLLVDMSESLNEMIPGTGQSLLELSEEALAIMSWTVEQLGDKFAIAGFNSDTRHNVRYQHIKGFSEGWGDEVKGRIAAMEAGYSTRMGAAMRHAAHYLHGQKAEKKLLLILTDGEPADIDTKDPEVLIQDTHKAVQELKDLGIFSYCISLDAQADDYVDRIFGNQYTVIDKLALLPEKLPKVFMQLTK